MSTERAVRSLADQLLREGYVDNEPDAVLAAMRLLTARAALRSRTIGREIGGSPIGERSQHEQRAAQHAH